MSYTVFALKWRPKNFEEIVGQPHVVNTLKSALKASRLGHAYLFSGPRGVGKTSTARILAKALNCKDGPTITPCQKCVSCREITESRSLDVIEIDGASNRGIDEIRALRESVKFSPAQGKFKIYIIDEVHMLTEPAFNALLKTLEEPPEFVKFIFATTHPDKIPLTILSRCQRFDFRRIGVLEIVAQLERIVQAENIPIDDDVLVAIAKASDGALRDAESVLDQLSCLSQEKIALKDVVSVLGLVEQEVLFAVTDRIIQKDPQGALKLLDELIVKGKDTGIFLNNLIEHFRNLMVAKITRADSKLIDLPQEICEKLFTQAGAFSLEEIFGIFNLLVNTREMSKRLESLRIPLEIALVKLAHDKRDSHYASTPPAPSPKPSATLKPPSANSSPAKPQGLIKEENQGSAGNPPGQSPVSLDEIKNIWQAAINSLAQVKMSVASYLNEGCPLRIERSNLTVAFPRDYSLHKECLEMKENRAMVEKTLSDLLSHNLRISFILSEELPSPHEEEDAFLKNALDAFKGRVVRKD